jgi:translation initiation factor IF-2
MAVAVKKYKLFKICKELNVGMDTIRPFLEERSVKISGPNTSITAEVYEEILENFSREKEIADKLHERKLKTEDSEDGDSDTLQDTKEPEEKSIYVQAIERSIEERMEEIIREEEEVKSEKPTRKRKKSTTKEEAKAKGVVEEAKEIIEDAVDEEVIEKDKSPKKEKKQEDAKLPTSDKTVTEEEVEEKKPKKKKQPEVIRKIDLDSIDEGAKTKKKPKAKDKKSQLKDDLQKEKEDKRRKAFEMIRKDEKRKRRMMRAGEMTLGEEPKRPRSKKQKKKTVDQKEVQETVKKTLATIDDKLKKPKKRRKVKDETGEVLEENIIYASEFISASDLANLMDVPVGEIITKCLELGLVVSINQRLDIDTIELLAGEWDYTVVKEEEYASDLLEEIEEEDADIEDTESRSPIVTIMGHVDHGKTSLLDFIRKSNVVEGESGGITQHIGAYEVEKNGNKITFLDTPGHEAFTAMRARGAQVTDIVILIIAADDEVKPQTVEAIDHSRAAGVKMIIAINKIDKPEANPERVKQQLSERNILVEDWGGEVQCAEISAKTGVGIDELLEKVLLEADLLDLKANKDKKAKGTVIETRLDKGKGVISSVLVQNGTLKIGDPFIAGQFSGKVRALLDDSSKPIKSAGPSQPVQVLGFDGLPQAGDRFLVMADEHTVKEISAKRQQIKREQDFRQVKLTTLDQISERIKIGGLKELRVLVKADVDGSAEALSDSLLKLSTKEVSVQVIRKAVGPISESDVLLAVASDAVIIGFHIRANVKAKELAMQENVEIRYYKVVYDVINDIKLALEGLLGTEKTEENIGTVEIRETFKISRLGTVAGCYVKAGKISRNSRVRLYRDDVEIYEGTLTSLRRFKEDVKEVATGFECGLQIQNYNDIKVGDIIEAFEIGERKRTLEGN